MAVAVGGVVGAALRWFVLDVFPAGGGVPWTVLVINVAGSAVVGAVLVDGWRRPQLRDAVAVGFCGGFTTFSTFAVEVAAMLRDGRLAIAAVYVALSVGGAVIAALAGAAAARRLRVPA